MRLIDADVMRTALLYDEEHEETKEVEMTIADFLDGHTEEGCPIESGWISVKDKRPNGLSICLGYGMGEYILMHVRNDGWIQPFVTHWIPLPEPPKRTNSHEER